MPASPAEHPFQRLLPKIYLALFVFVPLPFFTGTKNPFLIKETLAQTLLLAAALVFFIAKRESGSKLKRQPLTLPLLFFLAAVLFSLKNAVHKPLVLEFFFWQLLLVIGYHSFSEMKSPERGLVFSGIVFASLAAGIYGAVQRFGWDFFSWSVSWDDRPSSTFGNPNFAAGWWILATPLFLEKFFAGKKRWFWLLLALLMVFNLYWGRTRGAWIAQALGLSLAAAAGAGLKLEEKLKGKAVFIYAAFVVLAGFLFLGAQKAYQRASLSADVSVRERLFKWETARSMFREFPWFGVGAGHVKVHFALFQAQVKEKEPFRDLSLKGTSESNVHNEYFQIASELGGLGLAAFLLIFLFWVWQFRKNWFQVPDGRPGQLAVFAAVVSVLLFSFTNFPFHIPSSACLVFFLLSAFPNPDETQTEKRAAFKPDFLIRAGGLAVFILVFALVIFPPLHADRIRWNAEKAGAQGNLKKAVELYERSILMDFYHSERTAYDLGEIYRRTGNVPEAIRSYQVALRLRHYGEIYNNIGNCYYLLGNKTEAIQYWQTAARLGLPDVSAENQLKKNLEAIRHPTEQAPFKGQGRKNR